MEHIEWPELYQPLCSLFFKAKALQLYICYLSKLVHPTVAVNCNRTVAVETWCWGLHMGQESQSYRQTSGSLNQTNKHTILLTSIKHRVELGYNAVTGIEYFVSL
jgi:hypothetical protein